MSDLDPEVLKSIYGDTPSMANPLPTARKLNPQDVAKGVAISKKTGVDAILAAQNLPQFQSELDQDYWNKLVTDHPPAAKFMSDPVNAAIMQKDADSGALTAIADAAKSFLNGGKLKFSDEFTGQRVMRSSEFSDRIAQLMKQNPSLDIDSARLLAKQGVTIDNQSELAGEARRPNSTIGNLVSGLGTSFVESFKKADANSTRFVADLLGMDRVAGNAKKAADASDARVFYGVPQPENGLGRMVYGGVQSTVQQVPGLAMSIGTGNPIPSLASIFYTSAGGKYGDVRDRGGSVGESTAVAGLTGGLEVATEFIPLKFLTDRIGRMGVSQFAKEYLGKELVSEEVNTILSNAVDTAIANPDKTWGQYFAELPGDMLETAVQTLVQTGLLSGASHGLHKTVMAGKAKEWEAQQAEQSAQLLQSMQQTMAATDALKTNPETLQKFAQSLVEGGSENVYIEAKRLVDAGIDAKELIDKLPSVAAQLDTITEGGDIVVPIGELLTNSIGTTFAQTVIDHARTAPDAMSRVEAQEYMQEQGTKVQDEVQRVLQEREADTVFQQERDGLQKELTDQLNTMGRFKSDVNEKYAALTANFYAVMAARANMGLQEFVNTYRLGFASQEAVGKRTMDQGMSLQQLKDQLIEQRGGFDSYYAAVSGGLEPDSNTYFTLMDRVAAAEAEFTTELEKIPDAQFGIQATTKDGRLVTLNPSAQQDGKYQLTRFGNDGAPWGDTQYPTKRQAIADFLNEVDAGTVRDFGGKMNQAPVQQSTLTTDENGYPAISGYGVDLKFAQPTQRMEFIPTADNQQMFNVAIMDGDVYKGVIDVLFVDGKPAALYDIVVEQEHRKSGTAARAVGALLGATGGGTLEISNIVQAAQGFWEKLGIGVQNHGEGAAYDGTITAESFASSPAGKNAAGAGAVGGGTEGSGGGNTLYQGNPADLVAQHNLTAENLLHAVKMGGLPVPSLAVTKKDHPLTGFGEITLLAPSEMVDPKGYAATKVFGADIYSPRYPKVSLQFTPAMQRTGNSMLKAGMEATGTTYIDWSEVERDGSRELERLPAVMWQFLKEKGVEPPVVRTEPKPLPGLIQQFADDTRHTHELAADPAFQTAAWETYYQLILKAYDGNEAEARADVEQTKKNAAERGTNHMVNGYANDVRKYQNDKRASGQVDRSKTQWEMEKLIREKDLQGELADYAKGIVEELAPNERIFQGFNNSGSRKYTPHTLENVVKLLKKELRGGENFNYGVGSLRAKFTPQFKTLEQIRKAKGRLMDKAAFEAVKKEVDDELVSISERLGLSLEQTIEVLEDAPKMGVMRSIERAMKDYKRGEMAGINDEVKTRIAEYLTRLRNLPTEYFEAKILRDVSLSEFKGAVVPEGVDPKVIQALQDRGVTDIRTYKKNDDADRAAKIGEFGHLFFQQARGQISFGDDITQQPSFISLLQNADLSTFIHESGHFFLEVQADLATRIYQRMSWGDNVTDGERSIVDDFNKTLTWFGLQATPEMSILDQWAMMSIEEKRPYHEQFARGFEAYAFEGRAPSLELQSVFQTFRAWLMNVYKAIKKMVNQATGGKTFEQPAYHGTPHRGIDKFSTDKIGTGEGAQAFGWGLYFADRREVAEWYREQLSGANNGKRLELEGEHTPEQQEAANIFADYFADSDFENFTDVDPEVLSAWADDALENDVAPEVAEALRSLDVSKLREPTGQLYKVEIPEDNEMLLWDKPLSEQPEAVRKVLVEVERDRLRTILAKREASRAALAAEGGDTKPLDRQIELLREEIESENIDLGGTGERYYKAQTQKLGSDKAASEYLSGLGIKGIKYLDGTSRGAGDGSYNYVVFSGDDVAIKNQFYQSDKQIGEKLDVQLSDEVRGVMDRMLATSEAIAEAEAARSMGPLFKTPEQGGMDMEAFTAYHNEGVKATAAAIDNLQAKGLRDMQWLQNARSRKLKELQKQHAALRDQITIEVRAEVMAKPVYRAWTFLTARDGELVAGEKRKGNSVGLNPEKDNLFAAIAKLGGLDRAAVKAAWGIDEKERMDSGVFGAPVVRKTNGLSLDAMAERLVENGYMLPDENGKADLDKFEALFDDQRRGIDRFSIQRDMEASYGEQEQKPLDLPPVARGKLQTEELRERYGTKETAIWRRLSDLKMTSDEVGLSSDVVAEAHGFESGDALVRALADAAPPKEVIANMVDMRMLSEHGELATPDAIERAADAAIHNEARARFVATELRALEHAVSVRKSVPGQRATVDVLTQVANEQAQSIISKLKVREIRPNQYAAAAARAGRLAEKNISDLEVAAQHKRNQLINTQAAKVAIHAVEEIRSADMFFKRIVTLADKKVGQTRDMDVVNAARAVLASFGYAGKAQAAVKYLETLERSDPELFGIVKQSVDSAQAVAKPFKDLTYEEVKGLRAEIDALWHLAGRSKQMEVDGNLLDREELAQELNDRMVEIGVPEAMPGDTSAITPKEQSANDLRGLAAALRRVESWAELKDGGKLGVFKKYVFLPIKEAANTYRAKKVVALRDYRGLFDSIAPTMKRETIHAPELGYTFGKDTGGVAMNEILHAILHTGNESNKRKLLLGRGWGAVMENGEVDTRRWDSFIHRLIREGKLTKEHFDFAQGVWDSMESLKPDAQKAHRDAYGKYFEEVTADGFQMPWGSYRGGYVPAMADSRIVKDQELKRLVEEGKEGMQFAFPSTSKGFTKSRVEYNRPLLLDLRTLPQHIDKVLLFSHMENPVRDVSKLIGMKEVSEPLYRLDPAAINSMLMPWLNRAARQQVTTPVQGAGAAMRWANTLRNRTSMATMFANVSNTAQQITGFALAGVKVKPKYLVSAMAQYAKAPKKMAANVAELSPYMANRMSNEVGAMMGEMDAILLDPNLYEKTVDWTKRHTYFMQSAVDNVMGPIIWHGAFNEALEEGYSDDDAARIADSAVRQTQGSTLPEDVSRAETGNAFVRLFSQFYGYFNMQANLLGTEFGKVAQETGLRKGMGRAFYITMMAFYVPAMLAEAIAQLFKGGPGDEDKDGEWLDDWLMALFVYGPARNLTAFVPFVGQAVNSAVARFNGNPVDDKMSVSPVVGAIEGGAGVPYDLYKMAIGEGNAQRTVKDLATLISITTGLPANVAARPLSWLAGVAQDKIEPTGPVDTARGLVTGVASKESKQ